MSNFGATRGLCQIMAARRAPCQSVKFRRAPCQSVKFRPALGPLLTRSSRAKRGDLKLFEPKQRREFPQWFRDSSPGGHAARRGLGILKITKNHDLEPCLEHLFLHFQLARCKMHGKMTCSLCTYQEYWGLRFRFSRPAGQKKVIVNARVHQVITRGLDAVVRPKTPAF